MYYEHSVTIDANTAESDPTVEYIKLAHGIIQKIDIQFPIGCAGLVHCRLDYPDLLAVPADPTKNISSDGYIITVDGPMEVYREPYRWKATLWNDDDTFAHTVTIRFDMVEAKEVIMFARILAALTKYLRFMGIKV